MEFQVIPVDDEDKIKELAKLAEVIWNEHFTDIIGKEQVDYMLDRFQSFHAIKDQIENQGYQYYFMAADGEMIGYTGGHAEMEEHQYFLSKLYIKKDCRKKGYASRALEFMREMCMEKGLNSIYLTVNKYNYDTIEVYKKKGFETIREQRADIGGGFVMDDYVMELKL